MARQYDVTFQRPSGVLVAVRTEGNTKRSAERNARSWLRRHQGADPRRLTTMSVEFVPGSARAGTRPSRRVDDSGGPGDPGSRGVPADEGQG